MPSGMTMRGDLAAAVSRWALGVGRWKKKGRASSAKLTFFVRPDVASRLGHRIDGGVKINHDCAVVTVQLDHLVPTAGYSN